MRFPHDHTTGWWHTGKSGRRTAARRRRILNTGRGGILALAVLPLLAVAPAQAAAGQISEFKLAQGSTGTQATAEDGRMALGSDGDLYVGTGSPATIGRITPAGQITQFADPNAAASNIYVTLEGPDHNVWFADNGSEIGRITPAGQITMFGVPQFNGLRVGIVDMAAGPDGDLWFTANASVTIRRAVTASLVGRVDPATGAVSEFAIPSGAALPGAITAGSDGNLWFPEENLPGVGRVTPSGQVSEFTVTQGSIGSGPMALGSDGDLYFGTSTPATIGRITPAGQVTQFADPDTSATNVYLTAAGPDENVWFADDGFGVTSKAGRITPAGQISTFSVPLFDGQPIVGLAAFAAGPDGDLWFTANAGTIRTVAAGLVGRVDPATGAVTEFAIPSGAAIPGAITAGSDGNLWFPEENLPGVARVTVS